MSRNGWESFQWRHDGEPGAWFKADVDKRYKPREGRLVRFLTSGSCPTWMTGYVEEITDEVIYITATPPVQQAKRARREGGDA